MSAKPRVVVAMSGGVDSSVAAALLKQQGYEVTGMMMRLWNEPGVEEANRCCTPDAMALARRVAAKLSIPFYAIDAQQTFHEIVVTSFLNSYAQGDTPNPCVACNRQVRWEFLLERALAVGADFLATGHYVRLQTGPDGKVRLFKGLDPAKDQSYVLHVLTQEKLSHALFPLGGYTKPQVRELARQFNLPVADRPESQDLCFLGEGNLNGFLLRNAPEVADPGPILTRQGHKLGDHQGLAFYTIGQRKGLGLSSARPLYVLEKDRSRNALIVGYEEELGRTELLAVGVNWLAGAPPAPEFRAEVKIRYKAQPAWATIYILDGQPASRQARLVFDHPLRDITPGQAAVFYAGEECLGGGMIRL